MKLLLLCLSAAATGPTSTVSASSNLVSVTHQSYSRVYSTPHDPSHRIHIVKSDPDDGGDAYVASDFYRRVRDKRRLANSRIGERGDSGSADGDGDGPGRSSGVDHSLDHYFDHDITRPSHPADGGRETVTARTDAGGGDRGRGPPGADPPSSSTPRAAQDHRGGHDPRRVRGGGSSSGEGSSHHRIHQASHVHSHRDEFVAEHHLGLLRVPCSIALNSNEASLGHQLSNQVEGRVNVQGELKGRFAGSFIVAVVISLNFFPASAFELNFLSNDARCSVRRHGCAGDNHLGVRGEAGWDLPPHRPTLRRPSDW